MELGRKRFDINLRLVLERMWRGYSRNPEQPTYIGSMFCEKTGEEVDYTSKKNLVPGFVENFCILT